MFQFRCGLVKYKPHNDQSWFKPLLGGNSPMSSGLILKMNRCYKRGEQRAQEVHVVKGELDIVPHA
jgi:hypothetical protein